MKRTRHSHIAKRLSGALLVAAVLSAAVLSACDQNPIFNSISNETEKADPAIEGIPTRIVALGAELFVANGDLFKRDGFSWTRSGVTRPEGLNVRDLGAAAGQLFALTVENGESGGSATTSTKIWRSGDGVSWTQVALDAGVASYTSMDSLFVANGVLFAGVRMNDSSKSRGFAYAILRLNGSGELEAVIDDLDDGGAFVGAAWDGTSYYLAASDLGIYEYDGTTTPTAAIASTAGYSLTGIASVGGSVIAVGKEESTLVQPSHGVGFTAQDQDVIFTGAIAQYDSTNDGTPDLLLVGIRSGSSFGYREIQLTAGAVVASPTVGKANTADSSVEDYDQYAAALGVVTVNHLYQYWQAGRSVIFASTYLQGLWSSTDRGEWNLEK